MTQAQLAAATGIAKEQISRYERGISIPRPQILMRLAAALRVADEWLQSGYEGKSDEFPSDDIEGLQPALVERVRDAAAKSGRQFAEEVEYRLERSFADPVPLPADLRQRVGEAAAKSGRSIDAEVVYRLEQTLSSEPFINGVSLAHIFRLMEDMSRMIESGEFKPFDGAGAIKKHRAERRKRHVEVPPRTPDTPSVRLGPGLNGDLEVLGDEEEVERFLRAHGINNLYRADEGCVVVEGDDIRRAEELFGLRDPSPAPRIRRMS